MSNKLHSFAAFLLLFVLLLPMQDTFGQGLTNSSMKGRVIDSNGEGLIGATIQATHVPTGSVYGNVTNLDGYYRISNMRAGGPYKVEITYIGFQGVDKEEIYLTLGQSYQLNATLSEKANVLEEFEVVDFRNDVFDGNRTGAETTIGEAQIGVLPTVSRSIGDFTRLTPQATVTEGGDGFAISLNGMNNRYNAIYIDGAVNNDVFGLSGSGTNGGQTGVSPFSVDAIEEFQVSLAPFDVRVGGFAGGAINAVTRSGSNNFEGSIYTFFGNENLAGKTPTDNEFDELDNPSGTVRERLDDFSAATYGFRLGGPIIKNKVFFFVNAELQREETPQPFDINSYLGDAVDRDEEGNVTGEGGISTLISKLQNQYNYDPGVYNENTAFLNSDKITAKIDFNASQNSKFALKYSYVGAENLEAVRSSNNRIRFLNESEYFNSNTHSLSLDWGLVIGQNYANNLILGYTSVKDDRDPSGDNFPYVQIEDGQNGRITFGSEQFSTANQLDQSIFTLTDNFEIYKGRHNFTIGTHNEFFNVYNLFIRQNFGVYEYGSLDQFLNDENADEFYRSYSLVDNVTGDGSEAGAEFSGAQFGLYVQDEFQATDNLKLTLGLRGDMPVYFTDTRANEDFNTNTIAAIEAAGYDLKGATTGTFIKPQIMFSPRFGFNWDVTGEKRTQLRGGVGIFTSRIPLVWPGGAYNNNGFTVGGDFEFGPDFGLHDHPNWDQQPQNVMAGQGEPSGQIDLFAEDFKVPQVLKANLAVDQKLGAGIIANVDLLFNKTLNNVTYQNLNLKPAIGQLSGTGDNRNIYDRRDEIDPTYTRILLADNTNEGYTYNLTASLTKPFKNGFTGMLAYSYGDAYSIFDGTSSQNSSQWRGLHAINGRNIDQQLYRSDFSQGHRIIGALSYEINWNKEKNAATTISLFYEGVSGRPYSYVYGDGGDLTNEDSRDRALIYVPTDANDIVWAEGLTATETQEMWDGLNAFIESDDYLKERRGEYVERNSSRAPFSGVIDLKLVQDIGLKIGNQRHAFQLSADIFNFTNLLNKNWGRRYFVPQNYELLNFEGFQLDANGDETTVPTYSFDGITDNDPAYNSIDDSGVQSSRWQMRLGVRYLFK